MTSWLKNTFLKTLGLTPEAERLTTITRGKKRKADGDTRIPGKAQRHSHAMWRISPPDGLSPLQGEFLDRKGAHLAELTEVHNAELLGRFGQCKDGQSSLTRSPAGSSKRMSSKPMREMQEDGKSVAPSNRGTLPIGDGTQSFDRIDRQSQTIVEDTSPLETYQGAGEDVDNTKRNTLNKERGTAGAKKCTLDTTSCTGPEQDILQRVQEPEYSLRDVEIRDGLWQLMDQIERLTKTSFAFEVVPSGTTLPQRFFKQFSAETVKVIGCLASGGPGGVQGWHDLFLDVPKRQALVCAIISNVLVEQVFQHIFFGGIAKHVKNLTMLQEQHCNEDGFDRNTHYANHIRNILDPENSNRYFLPVNFANHVNYIVGAIWTHIRPIIKLRYYNPTTTTTTHTTDPIHDIIASLHKLVTHAAILSLSMRIDPHTVYAFDPVFKEDKFISRYMDCINQAQMQQSHPRALQYNADLTPQERNRRANISEKEAERALEDEPLVQIAIMPGLTAYRRGGWETVDSSVLGAPRFREEGYADMGYRARSLSAAWVFCRWGCVGRGEGGIDGAEVHGDAWVEPGFVEFVDVNGVNGGRGLWEDDVQA